jgi:CRISPR-associated Csx2 family protein
VFISVLGASFYGECKYFKDDYLSDNVRFIQEATMKMLVNKEWNQTSRAFFLTTKLARSVNWEVNNNVRLNPATKTTESYESLQFRLEKCNFGFETKAIDIPDGKNEQEMWEIFDIMYSLIEEGDELYFDLTHSFRYLPMLLLVFGNYVKFLKNAKVVHISYGNFEARNIETNIAPIVDLLPISYLQDWTFAAANYLENGNVKKMVSLSKQKLTPILAASSGSDLVAKNLQRFITYLEKVVDERISCRGINIIKSGNFRLLKQQSLLLENTLIEPLNPIIEKIKDSFESFDENENVQNGFAAVSWCINFGLYQQAVTILIENIVTYICIKHELNWSKESERLLVNTAFKVKIDNLPIHMWKVSNKEIDEQEKINRINKVKDLLKSDEVDKLFSIFVSLSDLRNDFNHAGMRNNPMSAFSLKNDFIEKHKKAIEIINSLDTTHTARSTPFVSPILINLSNHPSSTWSNLQMQAAAEQFGKVVDVPFPDIDPEWEVEQIEQLAQAYLERIEKIAVEHQAKPSVHLMGEYTFCFALVRKLQTIGINCVVSTSQRQATMNPDGTKTIMFNFVQFRPYSA